MPITFECAFYFFKYIIRRIYLKYKFFLSCKENLCCIFMHIFNYFGKYALQSIKKKVEQGHAMKIMYNTPLKVVNICN